MPANYEGNTVCLDELLSITGVNNSTDPDAKVYSFPRLKVLTPDLFDKLVKEFFNYSLSDSIQISLKD